MNNTCPPVNAVDAELNNVAKELIKYHHTWGQYIRNTYNMWIKGNPYVVQDDSHHIDFPDQRSQRIIENVWELLKIVE